MITWTRQKEGFYTNQPLNTASRFSIHPVDKHRHGWYLKDRTTDDIERCSSLVDCKALAEAIISKENNTTTLKAPITVKQAEEIAAKQKNGVHKLNDLMESQVACMEAADRMGKFAESLGQLELPSNEVLFSRINSINVFTFDEHLDNLIRHITLVREGSTVLGKRFISQGRKDLGRLLIARGFIHDASKFSGIEWDYLHAGSDVPQHELDLAVKQHVRTNAHHPEFHGGISNMPPLDIAEMVCDWYARSHEFGTDLRQWIEDTAVERFDIDTRGEQYYWINECVDLLLQDSFKRNGQVHETATC